MAIRLHTGKRNKLIVESDDYTLGGSMEIIDGASTGVMKYVQIHLGDYWLYIDRKDIIKAYDFLNRIENDRRRNG